MKKLLLFFPILILFCSCGNSVLPPYPYEKNPAFLWGQQLFYGDYYADQGIANNITSVRLFSESLRIVITADSTAALTGVGQMLELYDIVLPGTDTLLSVGTYTADNNYNEFTFLKGTTFEENGTSFQTGSYINFYEVDNSKSTSKLIKSGTFVVSRVDSLYTITCQLTTDDDQTISGTFNGYTLPAYDLSFRNKYQGMPRFSYYLWK